jgi:hypothetical protein
MKVALTADLGWEFQGEGRDGKEVVVVWFGDAEIAKLPPARKSRAGHGDDSSFFDAEEQAIVEETVAPFLRRIFERTDA